MKKYIKSLKSTCIKNTRKREIEREKIRIRTK